MVFGPKKQSSNKIISGKPADVNEYGLPPSVGSKKSGGFANRLLSVAQPRRKTKTKTKTKTPSQRSCEYFYIEDNASGDFLDTLPDGKAPDVSLYCAVIYSSKLAFGYILFNVFN